MHNTYTLTIHSRVCNVYTVISSISANTWKIHDYKQTSPKFWTQEVLNIRICIEKQTDVFVFYLSVTYYQFQFPLFVCSYTMSDRTWFTNSYSSIRNIRQRVTTQNTVNANESCTEVLPRSCWFRIYVSYSYVGIDCKEAEFIDNKQTD